MTGFDNIEHACESDVGVRRSHNQDNWSVQVAADEQRWRAQGHIFLVADGMGAHAVGEKASELAKDIIPLTYHKHALQGAASGLRKSFVEANASIHDRGQKNREFAGMGTTATALVLRPEGAWVAHVGDSRAYRVRDGVIEQLSADHSLVWEFAKRQQIDPDTVKGLPTNVIVRSLGPEPLVQVDVEGPHPLRDGDIFVLCSDGLSGQVNDAEIGAVVSVLPPKDACRFLVDLANLRGGPDNITVLVVRLAPAATAVNGPAPRRRRLPRVPWPLVALLVGTLLAGGAAWLTSAQQYPLGVIAFVAAAGAIGAGLIGLAVDYARERRKAEQEPEPSEPQIYRHSPCRVDRPLLEKLSRGVETLRLRVEERQWPFATDVYQEHRDQAEAARKQNDLSAAFREYCLAMRPLSEALQRHRSKEEEFKPVWDKKDTNAAGKGPA